jgi:predicted nucleotidyltransferase
MRNRMIPLWEEQEFQQDILWAGIFGSVARNRAHSKSDVDIVCVFKDHLRCSEPVYLRDRESFRVFKDIGSFLLAGRS